MRIICLPESWCTNVEKFESNMLFAWLTGTLMAIQSPAGEIVVAFKPLSRSHDPTASLVAWLGATSASAFQVREREISVDDCRTRTGRTSSFDKCWPYFELLGSLTL